jgi:hypothetical protein
LWNKKLYTCTCEKLTEFNLWGRAYAESEDVLSLGSSKFFKIAEYWTIVKIIQIFKPHDNLKLTELVKQYIFGIKNTFMWMKSSNDQFKMASTIQDGVCFWVFWLEILGFAILFTKIEMEIKMAAMTVLHISTVFF